MQFEWNDGGRIQAGFHANSGDCVCRSISIAAELPYRQVYDLINELAQFEHRGKCKKGISSARNGVYKQTTKKVLQSLGWQWTPTMGIGTGCKVHLKDGELPMGRLIVRVSKHLTAVINCVIMDTHDCSRNGTRCVYGYWTKV